MKALLFYGGWLGHDPLGVACRLAQMLEREGFECDVREGTACLARLEPLLEYSLIVPNISMGSISETEARNVCEAVARGVGIAGLHGGMCDSFRDNTDWQLMTGGQFVGHPGGQLDYRVELSRGVSDELKPLTEGIADFDLHSEQYYMHFDPAVEILATTHAPLAEGPHASNRAVEMPVAWVKYWGAGRVYYCALGHTAAMLDEHPQLGEMLRRGFLWAAKH